MGSLFTRIEEYDLDERAETFDSLKRALNETRASVARLNAIMQSMQRKAAPYVPALSYKWLTPLYDSLIRWTMPEYTFKRRLIRQARIKSSHLVLDLGCGTATLTRLIKRTHPEASVGGIDGDAKILEIARRKANDSGLDIIFAQGMAFNLPYSDASFDRVLSSLVFHHLTRENKSPLAERGASRSTRRRRVPHSRFRQTAECADGGRVLPLASIRRPENDGRQCEGIDAGADA